MTTKTIRIPGPDHPITIAPTPGRVVVTAGGRVVADSRAALTLQEAAYPPVLYLPRADVDMTLLERNAVWTYEQPYDAVAAIREHVAFYPDRVDSIALHD